MLHLVCILTVFGAEPEEWPTLWPTVPPVVAPIATPFDELRNKGGEWAAPIPDSLVTHTLHDSEGNAITIVLEAPIAAKETLTRLPGPRHAWGHPGCSMCLGNHMIQSHGESESHLRSLGYSGPGWGDLHDNYHNDPATANVRKSGSGYIGYEAGGGGSYRQGLLSGLRGRIRGRRGR